MLDFLILALFNFYLYVKDECLPALMNNYLIEFYGSMSRRTGEQKIWSASEALLFRCRDSEDKTR